MDYTSFLENKIEDNNGRKIEDILHFSPTELEVTNNYIKSVFPLDTASKHPDIEPISEEDIKRFKKSKKAQKNLSKMYQKMLDFWKLNGNQFMEWEFLYPFRHWNMYNDHNHKRITRVLKSLKLLGMNKEYKDFSMRIKYILKLKETNNYIHIDNETIKNWNNVIKN